MLLLLCHLKHHSTWKRIQICLIFSSLSLDLSWCWNWVETNVKTPSNLTHNYLCEARDYFFLFSFHVLYGCHIFFISRCVSADNQSLLFLLKRAKHSHAPSWAIILLSIYKERCEKKQKPMWPTRRSREAVLRDFKGWKNYFLMTSRRLHLGSIQPELSREKQLKSTHECVCFCCCDRQSWNGFPYRSK